MGEHGYVKHDPAVERWDYMREDVYRHFRFTPRTTRVVLLGVVLVPGAIYYVSKMNDLKWSWRGKLKGESLRAAPEAT